MKAALIITLLVVAEGKKTSIRGTLDAHGGTSSAPALAQGAVRGQTIYGGWEHLVQDDPLSAANVARNTEMRNWKRDNSEQMGIAAEWDDERIRRESERRTAAVKELCPGTQKIKVDSFGIPEVATGKCSRIQEYFNCKHKCTEVVDIERNVGDRTKTENYDLVNALIGIYTVDGAEYTEATITKIKDPADSIWKFVVRKTAGVIGSSSSSKAMREAEFITRGADDEIILHWLPFEVTGIVAGNTITWGRKIFTKKPRTVEGMRKAVAGLLKNELEAKENAGMAVKKEENAPSVSHAKDVEKTGKELREKTFLLKEATARFEWEASKCNRASVMGTTQGKSKDFTMGHYLTNVEMNKGCNQKPQGMAPATFAAQWVPYMGCVANCEPTEEIACNTFMHLRNNDARSKTGSSKIGSLDCESWVAYTERNTKHENQ